MGKKTRRKKYHVHRKRNVSHTPDKGTQVQRTHKDKLFRFIFRDKKALLQLYNALNESNHQNEDDLVITTLENVMYLGYKNDVSFLLDWLLFLIEHQGSWNPNMPLRGVLYFARIFSEFTARNGYDLYGSALIPLPCPQYVVFYNGAAPRPEREVLKLSDAFQNEKEGIRAPFAPALECRVLVLNINYGQNRALMEKCKPLMEYSLFIHHIRQHLSQGIEPEQAVNLAIDQCIKKGIMADILRGHRREIVGMFLEDYDAELHEKTLKEEGHRLGCAEGKNLGQERMARLIKFLRRDNRLEDLWRSAEDIAFREALFREYRL